MTEPVAKGLTGGCQCGAVRYRLNAVPKRASVCHCRMCQKATGSPVGVFATLDGADIVWTAGRPTVFASSNLAERGFCNACGTPLTYRFVEGEEISVTVCSLDEPDTIWPARQYCGDSKRAWFDAIGALSLKDLHFPGDAGARIAVNQHPDREA